MSLPVPYYQSERVTLYCGDCLSILPHLAGVDAVVTDPPYFRVKDEEWDRQWDNADAFVGWLRAAMRAARGALNPNGSVFVFTSPEMNTRVEAMMRDEFAVLNNIRWIKDAGWHRKAERASLRSWLTPWEGIIFAEQRGDQYADASLALHKQVYAPIGRVVQQKREAASLQRWQIDEACSPSKKPTGLCYRWEEGACLPTEEQFVGLCRVTGDTREYEDLRREYEDLRREYEDLRRPFNLPDADDATDCWTFATVAPREAKHPCEKPVPMLQYMIESTTRRGGLVVDGFCGSGSTGVACVRADRRFVGVEKCPRYIRTAARRIQEAEQAFALFEPVKPEQQAEMFTEEPA